MTARVARPAYRRVLLKLSGEALAGPGGTGVDPQVLHLVAREIKSVRDDGVDVAIVIGGGNIVRGVQIAEHMGVTRATAASPRLHGPVSKAPGPGEARDGEGPGTRARSSVAPGTAGG